MAKNLGLGTSAAKLRSLGFDPIEAQVKMYELMVEEIKNQEKLATGELVRLNKDGSTKAYSIGFHMSLVERAAMLSEKLMRYGYARVSESNEVTTDVPALNIRLNDQGGTFSLNPKDDTDQPTPDAE